MSGKEEGGRDNSLNIIVTINNSTATMSYTAYVTMSYLIVHSALC